MALVHIKTSIYDIIGAEIKGSKIEISGYEFNSVKEAADFYGVKPNAIKVQSSPSSPAVRYLPIKDAGINPKATINQLTNKLFVQIIDEVSSSSSESVASVSSISFSDLSSISSISNESSDSSFSFYSLSSLSKSTSDSSVDSSSSDSDSTSSTTQSSQSLLSESSSESTSNTSISSQSLLSISSTSITSASTQSFISSNSTASTSSQSILSESSSNSTLTSSISSQSLLSDSSSSSTPSTSQSSQSSSSDSSIPSSESSESSQSQLPPIGSSWTAGTHNGGRTDFALVYSIGDDFYIGPQGSVNSTTGIWKTTDGSNWTEVTPVGYSNLESFVVVGSTLFTTDVTSVLKSTNGGTSWTTVTTPPNNTYKLLESNGRLFSMRDIEFGDSTTLMSYSDDEGSTWTSCGAMPAMCNPSKIAYNGSNRMVMGSSRHFNDNHVPYAYSTDNGATWTGSGAAGSIQHPYTDIVYFNGQFIGFREEASGSTGVIGTSASSSGTSWTDVLDGNVLYDSFTAAAQPAIDTTNNKIFAMAAGFGPTDDNDIISSANGTSWSKESGTGLPQVGFITDPAKIYIMNINQNSNRLLVVAGGTSGHPTDSYVISPS